MSMLQPIRYVRLFLSAGALSACAIMVCSPAHALADCQAGCSANGSQVSLLDAGSSLLGAGSSLLGTGSGLADGGARALARTIVPPQYFPSFDQVITHESGWNVFALNFQSGAYGLGQALPAIKMSSTGADWLWDPATQIRWTYDYMCERYGNPDNAWAFWQVHHWY
jgi:hypothetical protein